jgi:class 3 adenylate cyclase
MSEEIVRLALEAGDLQLELQGWLWSSMDHLELGDWESAQLDSANYTRRVNDVRSPYYRWFGVIWDGMRALAEGRLEEGEALAQKALAIGQGTGNANAFQIFGAQLNFLRLAQRRLREIEPVLQAAIAQNPDLVSWRCVLAITYAETSRLEEARTIVEELSADECAALPRDFLFLISWHVLALAVRRTEDGEAARRLYAAARQYEDRIVLIPGVLTGSGHEGLACLATVAGDWAVAEQHFKEAIAVLERLDAAFQVAFTRVEWARMLLRRDGPGDRARALDLLNLALDAGYVGKWTLIIEDALALKLQAQGSTGSSADTASIDTLAETVHVERPDLRAHMAPDGTVTIMFSDIEGSTALAERLGDEAWMNLLRGHDEVVRACVTEHGGHEVKHLGDGFMITFPSARRAVQCAAAVQRAVATMPEPVRVRIGLHAGDVIRDDEDFFGRSVIVASRIAGQACGGEVLVSAVVKELVAGSGNLRLDGGRDIELKGLEGTHRVFALQQ